MPGTASARGPKADLLRGTDTVGATLADEGEGRQGSGDGKGGGANSVALTMVRLRARGLSQAIEAQG